MSATDPQERIKELLALVPKIREKLMPDTNIGIVVLASSAKRQRELNGMIDIGENCQVSPHFKHHPESNIWLNTYHIDEYTSPTIFRGRTNLMVVVDSQLRTDKFPPGLWPDIRITLERTLCTVAYEVNRLHPDLPKVSADSFFITL